MATALRVRAARGTFTRTWQFRRKAKGRPSITTLGTYPELSIKEARLKAAELATKRQQSSPTVEEAAEQWMGERVDHTHRKADQVRGYVDRAIIAELGDMRVRDVEPADIARVIRAYRDRIAKLPRGRTGGRPAARALLAAFKGLFGYCVANGWISISPAAQLTAAVTGPPPQARERVLTDDEIRFVMTTDIKPAPVLRFLLATGLRLGEAYAGHRAGQYWIVPAKVAKNRREHRVWRSRWPSSIRIRGKPGGRRRRGGLPTVRMAGRLTTCAAPLAPGTTAWVFRPTWWRRCSITRSTASWPSTTMPPTSPSGARRWKHGQLISWAWRHRQRLSFLFARG
jgi:integrase